MSGAAEESQPLARTLSRVLAAVLVGGAVGAAAKGYGAAGSRAAAGSLADALGVDWTAVRAAAGAVDTRQAAAWAALAALVAVACGAGARALTLWRRGHAAAGAPPHVQDVAVRTPVPNRSDARRTVPTRALAGAAARATAALSAAAGAVSAAADATALVPARLGAAVRRPAGRPARPAAVVAPSRVHALAAAGASPAEIARRTGLARDAVTLALAIAR